MTNMETIVRPFAPVAVFPAASVFRLSRGADSNEQVLGGGGGREVSFTFNNESKAAKWPDTEKFKESGRESTKVKVENPDDSEQFVEFCQAKSVSLKKERDGAPPRKTSYGTSGNQGVNNRDYGFNYDKENKQCKPQKGPPKGCA